jgi:hypothetical protein
LIKSTGNLFLSILINSSGTIVLPPHQLLKNARFCFCFFHYCNLTKFKRKTHLICRQLPNQLNLFVLEFLTRFKRCVRIHHHFLILCLWQ